MPHPSHSATLSGSISTRENGLISNRDQHQKKASSKKQGDEETPTVGQQMIRAVFDSSQSLAARNLVVKDCPSCHEPNVAKDKLMTMCLKCGYLFRMPGKLRENVAQYACSNEPDKFKMPDKLPENVAETVPDMGKESSSKEPQTPNSKATIFGFNDIKSLVQYIDDSKEGFLLVLLLLAVPTIFVLYLIAPAKQPNSKQIEGIHQRRVEQEAREGVKIFIERNYPNATTTEINNTSEAVIQLYRKK